MMGLVGWLTAGLTYTFGSRQLKGLMQASWDRLPGLVGTVTRPKFDEGLSSGWKFTKELFKKGRGEMTTLRAGIGAEERMYTTFKETLASPRSGSKFIGGITDEKVRVMSSSFWNSMKTSPVDLMRRDQGKMFIEATTGIKVSSTRAANFASRVKKTGDIESLIQGRKAYSLMFPSLISNTAVFGINSLPFAAVGIAAHQWYKEKARDRMRGYQGFVRRP